MKSVKQSESEVKGRRKFDDTFKSEAVKNWLSSGKSAGVVAKELGLEAGLLYAWKKGFAPDEGKVRMTDGSKPGSLSDLQAQLEAALRENRHLKEQRDILKKTLGILSEPSPSALNGFTR